MRTVSPNETTAASTDRTNEQQEEKKHTHNVLNETIDNGTESGTNSERKKKLTSAKHTNQTQNFLSVRFFNEFFRTSIIITDLIIIIIAMLSSLALAFFLPTN